MVHGSGEWEDQTGCISIPIYQSATFKHKGLNQSTGYDYSRLQNPTREELEKTIAKLEGGKEGLAFSTGMAAIDCVARLLKPGEHIIISDDLYGGTYRLFEDVYKVYGIESTYVDTTDLEKITMELKDNTKAIYMETPSNPMMKVSDIGKISALAKERGLITIVDNTFLTPYFQRPMDFGADIVVHSGTKFLGGHNDTLAGLLVASREDLIEKLRFTQVSIGATLSPFDSWLMLRGIKTLAIRLEKQQENAKHIALWLKNCDAVEKVYYPGFKEHEGYEVSLKQTSGFGSIISFTVKEKKAIGKVLEEVEIVSFAESLGGVESLITYPYLQTHASIPEEIRNRMGVTDKLLRISVGIENVNDIIDDLSKSLNYFS
ncbi:trans-sulfuration enzyme family protein [Clostridium estertheticum]|uniref:trans-sulfuration enzyme family protein n=1 Tax=Clostridium estertheticum TaxID=238834 RepID=UPI001CF2C5B6|nr:PLP-dependent aspartate aminotransferase family protein [Clostridium estertheticum]MCB2353820.1 PLP-dependent aspartate aminotransferase family protein [Clostridium estertheticum]WAG43553.1 PLP-dependent aspartate aminotransferase family protein [Clostridium estertheticum]